MLKIKAKHIKKESFIMAKKVKISNNTVAAVLYVLVGVLFCIFKASMLNWLLTAAGIVFIVLGVLDILKKNLVNGIVEAVIGVVILVGGWAFVEVALIIFGALLCILLCRAILFLRVLWRYNLCFRQADREFS